MDTQELDTLALNLAHTLKDTLSNVVGFYFAAQRAHWNVTGEDFSQYHELFGHIYTDTYGSIDGFAENVRKLNYFPDSIIDMITQSKIQDDSTTTDALTLAADLLHKNEDLIDSLASAFTVATTVNSQGIADYIAARIDAHEKWSWQLRSCIAPVERTDSSIVIAESTPKQIEFSPDTQVVLANKVASHNAKLPSDKRISLDTLSAVYRRGAQSAVAARVTPSIIASIALERVDNFLRLVASGRPANPSYRYDNDLLPSTHSLCAVTSSAAQGTASRAEYVKSQLAVHIAAEEEYESPEDILFSMAEYSGLGYETIPAFRAAWLRALSAHEDPYVRVMTLATKMYESKDSDLLPVRTKHA